MQASGILKSEKSEGWLWTEKKQNAIFKGSLIAMTVLLWEGSGICRNRILYGQLMRAHNTDSMEPLTWEIQKWPGKSVLISETPPSLGEKFSGLEKGKGLNGFSGNIPSVTDGTNTQSSTGNPK